MCPTSVFIPVPVTIAVAFPPVTEVEERIIFFLSPSAVNSSSTTDASFSAFTDSPVREDSSVVRLLDVTRRQSAATRSPADIISISPGTTFAAGILSSLPFLSTQAWGDYSFFKASRLFSARFS